jgi:hypothetical protein
LALMTPARPAWAGERQRGGQQRALDDLPAPAFPRSISAAETCGIGWSIFINN